MTTPSLSTTFYWDGSIKQQTTFINGKITHDIAFHENKRKEYEKFYDENGKLHRDGTAPALQQWNTYGNEVDSRIIHHGVEIANVMPKEIVLRSPPRCGVCDGMRNRSNFRELWCGHAFHSVCYDKWLFGEGASTTSHCPRCDAYSYAEEDF